MFNILGIEPIKSYQQIVNLTCHNHRLGKKYKQVSNVNPELSHKNKFLHNRFNIDISKPSALKKAIESHYNDLDIKTNQNTTYGIEFMITASPEFFAGKSDEFIYEWANKQNEFMLKQFGEKLTMSVLHMDEKTPHLHFLTTTEQRTEKKYKNQFGDFHKITNSLSSHFLDKKYIKTLLDNLEKSNLSYKLKRGIEGSTAVHQRPAIHNKEVQIKNKKLEEENKLLKEKAEKYKEEINKVYNTFISSTDIMLNNIEAKIEEVKSNIDNTIDYIDNKYINEKNRLEKSVIEAQEFIQTKKLKFNEFKFKRENQVKIKL